MKVEAELEYGPVTEAGKTRDGVMARCPDCGESIGSFGQEAKSVRRCLAMLKDVCSCHDAGSRWFVAEDASEE